MPEASVEKILGEHFPHKREIVRMYEYDGYDTSLEIAKTLVNRGRASESSVIIVSGAQAPRGVDALAGAALAGINNNVILLVNANPKIEGVHTEVNCLPFLGQGNKSPSGLVKVSWTEK